ncbi:spaetzle-processing enzyme-like [Drosophila ficusphila]|uniref:spaetzle-processing enzyme-like n=1 Tax=Drosophila ficusphila TaxID=30025 RepID=UPI0007E7A0B4|nr:spaetzle-processing enzyme-like [Drosophila ficusphila]
MFFGQTVFILLVLQFLLLPLCAFSACQPEEKCVHITSCRFLLRKTYGTSSHLGYLLRIKPCGYREAHFVCCQVLPKSCGELPPTSRTNAFPWTVKLLYQDLWDQVKPYTQRCTGSLINKRYVVTAAHCINLGRFILKMVRLGEHKISTDKDCVNNLCAPPYLDVHIEEKIIHEDYDSNSPHNDIALLRLVNHVDYSNAIKPICILPSSDIRNHFFINETMIVAGWGVTPTKTSRDVLRWTIVKGRKCKQPFRNSTLCALSMDGTDSTRSDSGGPLMARMGNPVNESVYLAGITLLGGGNYHSGSYGIIGSAYTRTEYFINWIKEKLIPSSQDEF